MTLCLGKQFHKRTHTRAHPAKIPSKKWIDFLCSPTADGVGAIKVPQNCNRNPPLQSIATLVGSPQKSFFLILSTLFVGNVGRQGNFGGGIFLGGWVEVLPKFLLFPFLPGGPFHRKRNGLTVQAIAFFSHWKNCFTSKLKWAMKRFMLKIFFLFWRESQNSAAAEQKSD